MHPVWLAHLSDLHDPANDWVALYGSVAGFQTKVKHDIKAVAVCMCVIKGGGEGRGGEGGGGE